MKIASSELQLQSQHSAVERRERQESLRLWTGRQDPREDPRQGPAALAPAREELVQLSRAAQASQPTRTLASGETRMTSKDDFKLQLLVAMIESLTGKRLKLAAPEDLGEKIAQAEQSAQQTASELSEIGRQASAGEAPSAGFGLEYDAYEYHYESEKMQFSAQGVVQTQDGQQIDIAVELSMSREFVREQRISIRAGDARLSDPLVLNFNGAAAELTDTRFSFDIDSDGRPNQIAGVGANSAFLALDRNGDGTINDGSELFGPTSGSGFQELAAHDQDANGWIDENDSVYANLRLWFKDGEGRDQLIGLGERGVGAIYLGHITSPFSIRDDQNGVLGQVRSSGVYLTESGNAGSIQQVDLAI